MTAKPFEIILEDEYLIVLNKIAKLLIQPTPKKERITLTSLLEEHLKAKAYPCHRLDRETTGLIIYAKNRSIQKKVMDQFRAGQVSKGYYALVKGKLKSRRGILEGHIQDKEGERFGEKSKFAKTSYAVIGYNQYFSIVDLRPQTGRTNQLRIQMAKEGNPILGEEIYAFRRDFPIKFKRLALHAFFISFIHPVGKDKVTLEIPLAEDMRDFLKKFS